MTIYVPTTEDVRARYQRAGKNEFGHQDPKWKTDPEFEAWLAEVIRAAREEGWEACVDAHEQVLARGRSIDSNYMSRANPYNERGSNE